MSKIKRKKPILRWIGEATLIFLSILGAFYVDNYRESKDRQRTYLKHIEDFRYDLRANAASMTFEIESEGGDDLHSGYLRHSLASLERIESLLMMRDPVQLPEILEEFTKLDDRLAKWIFPSPHYDKLALDYYYFIQNPDLKSSITTHRKDNLHRQEAKDILNELLSQLVDLQADLNFEATGNLKNGPKVFNNRMINTIGRIKDAYLVLIQTTELTLNRDALILEEIEDELGKW